MVTASVRCIVLADKSACFRLMQSPVQQKYIYIVMIMHTDSYANTIQQTDTVVLYWRSGLLLCTVVFTELLLYCTDCNNNISVYLYCIDVGLSY